MSASARIVGWLWLLVPLFLLAYQAWEGANSAFLGFGYYFVAWGGLLILALCGAWFLIGMPGAKWMLRTAAVTVALFIALNGLIASSNAPYYGGHDFVFYAYLGLAVAFCVVTFLVALRRAA